VTNLFTRKRRRNIDAGFRRAAIVISLAFVVAGSAMLYQAVVGGAGEAGQAVLVILIGLGMVAYQRWGQ
jgi:hypothetical protein